MFGKGPFGSGVNISAEIVNGVCPKCIQPTVLISLYETMFKCTTCGETLEQKINGVISYIPMSHSGLPHPRMHGSTDGPEKS
jgi:ribosomal protein S27E|tara:strand:- start:236 stop:481 length:246 start_codon:yes stop_codon:yes gene_type:complete